MCMDNYGKKCFQCYLCCFQVALHHLVYLTSHLDNHGIEMHHLDAIDRTVLCKHLKWQLIQAEYTWLHLLTTTCYIAWICYSRENTGVHIYTVNYHLFGVCQSKRKITLMLLSFLLTDIVCVTIDCWFTPGQALLQFFAHTCVPRLRGPRLRHWMCHKVWFLCAMPRMQRFRLNLRGLDSMCSVEC